MTVEPRELLMSMTTRLLESCPKRSDVSEDRA